MATTIKQSRVLQVELTDSVGATALTWRLNNPKSTVSRSDVVTVCGALFAANNNAGYNILKSQSGIIATGVGKVQTVDTNITTTDLV